MINTADINADASLSTELSEFGPDKRGHKGPERRCIATGKSYDKSALIRFVRAPDGTVTPDISGKLPGRGVYVSCYRTALYKAIKTKGFARGFKSKVQIPDDLDVMIETQLARRVIGLLTMAMKSGRLIIGFDQVKGAARSEPLGWRVEASDGSADGRGKIRVLTRAVSRELGLPIPSVIGCFTAAELGQCLGRESLVHGAVKPGKLSANLSVAARRLSGFRPLIPEDWPDRAHEVQDGRA